MLCDSLSGGKTRKLIPGTPSAFAILCPLPEDKLSCMSCLWDKTLKTINVLLIH